MTPLPAVRGLVTVALLKAQFDQGKDHIGMFLPFLLDTLAHMHVTNADAAMIKVAIEERHGLAIPTPTPPYTPKKGTAPRRVPTGRPLLHYAIPSAGRRY